MDQPWAEDKDRPVGYLQLPCSCLPLDADNEWRFGFGAEGTLWNDCPHVCHKLLDRADDREIQVFETLGSHPRIVEFYGHEKQKILYLRYHRLKDVTNVFHKVVAGKLPLPSLRTRWQWVIDAATALSLLHSHGIMHQDLSAGNLLVQEDLQHVVLCDFGRAYIPGQPRMDSTGSYGFCQFIYYEPPSLVQDHFALAACAYFIITGKRMFEEILYPDQCPFDGERETLQPIIRAACQAGRYPALPQCLPQLLKHHLIKCWRGDYTSTDDILEDLKNDMQYIKVIKSDPWNGRIHMSREQLGRIAAQTPLPPDDSTVVNGQDVCEANAAEYIVQGSAMNK